ncbi:MAG: hypothetical protein Q8868_06325 [Bacteroidota bacterium]|jgi:membrane associated rhomboid family serine protease|nr:hypothetical protein [Bacteroidota bacterium]
MDNNRIMKQITAIFNIFMVFFYIGVGIFLAFFFKNTYMNKAVLGLMGGVFIMYGLYRAYRAYVSIVELFFRSKEDDE